MRDNIDNKELLAALTKDKAGFDAIVFLNQVLGHGYALVISVALPGFVADEHSGGKNSHPSAKKCDGETLPTRHCAHHYANHGYQRSNQ